MKILLSLSTILFSIGSFFSNTLCNIGFFGLWALSLLEIINNKDVLTIFKDFNKSYKLWIPVLYLVTLAYIRLDFFNGKENLAISFSVACKYTRFLAILFIIPVFSYYKQLTHILLQIFTVSCFIYCLYAYPTEHFNTCIIHTSVFIALICSWYCCKIFTTQPTRTSILDIVRNFFFLLALLILNSEKTGPVAGTVAVITAAAIAVRKKIWYGLLICFTILFSCISIAYKLNSSCINKLRLLDTHTSSVHWRLKMIKESIELISEKPLFGFSTGGYKNALIEHSKDYLGDKNVTPKYPHPHNEWLLWMVQWGIFGLLAFILFFVSTFLYFIKNFSCKNYFNNPITFYSFWGILLNIIFIISGGCEAIFFRTLPQSVYLLGLCICIANIETHKNNIIR